MDTKKINFLLIRLPIALSLAGHGLVRLPKLNQFAEWMMVEMEKSIFPKLVILSMAYIIPIMEAILGILLLFGIKTRYTLYASFILIGMLIAGSTSVENWDAVVAQLVHGLYLGFLLWWYEERVK